MFNYDDYVFIQTCIAEVFPNREEENVTVLMNAAEVELDGKEAEKLDYKSLFMEVSLTLSSFTK